MKFDYPEGATPLDADEAQGLLLSHITSRNELDRWEQENIAEAEAWAFRRMPRDILTEGFIKRLHKRMFGTVWKWAGKKTGYRQEYRGAGLADRSRVAQPLC